MMHTELYYQFSLILSAILMVVAAMSDAVRFRIPNLVCLAILLTFPLFVYTAPVTVPWVEHIITFAIILVLGYQLFARGFAGAGDIKLLAVIGLWAGPNYWPHFLFITAATGGILSLGIGGLTILRHKLSKKAGKVDFAKTPIPYGVAIAVGGLCTLALLSHPDLLASKV